jgi:hypothetical protein
MTPTVALSLLISLIEWIMIVSPLRTDSLPLVSKMYWPGNADDAIMDAS